MKLITWNCNGAFRKKYQSLQSLNADILVIQECENPETTKDTAYREWASNFLWTGDRNHKGLGIFADKNIKIEKLNWQNRGLKYFIPCRVNDQFNLVGTWCCFAETYAYIGQLWRYIQLHQKKFGSCMLCGDFNSNVFWDKPRRTWNHSDVVRKLQSLKIESFYHVLNQEAQGQEKTPTFYFTKNVAKPYHIDYIFGSAELCNQLIKVEIGHPDQWLGMSDHMPVSLNLDLLD